MELYKTSYRDDGLCNRCGSCLGKRQQRWCSRNCSRLGLKREYKKRNKTKVNEYIKDYRKRGLNPMNEKQRLAFLNKKKCARCNTNKGLEAHHVKPRLAGGTHETSNLLPLCRPCHLKWEKRMKGYWIEKKVNK